MKQFFASWTFIILLCAALVLTIVPSGLALMGQGAVVRNALGVLVDPARRFCVWVGEGVGGFVEYFTTFDRIAAENAVLRAELDRLRDDIADADAVKNENEWLRDYLGLKREHEEYSLCEARIIGRGNDNLNTVFTLDRGSASGVKRNMPVITADGIVGMVTEVGLTWCKVGTLLENANAIGVYCERSGVFGVSEGSYELAAEGRCHVTYLAADADIRVGDRFLTTGVGSVYPHGLAVGEVVALSVDPFARGIVAELRPLASLEGLSRVMIVTAATVESEDSANVAADPAATDGTANASANGTSEAAG